MTIPEFSAVDFQARVEELPPDQQQLLRHMIIIMLDCVTHPERPALLMHSVPAAEDADLILVHCLTESVDAADEMLVNFMEARNAHIESKNDTTPRH